MKTVVLNIQDSVFDKVIYFLKNLPKQEVKMKVIEDFDYISPSLENELKNMIDEYKKGKKENFISLKDLKKVGKMEIFINDKNRKFKL
jgi:hypothetical protein